MGKLLFIVGVALTGLMASTALAGNGALWNYGKVLGEGRANFSRLCKNEGGTIRKVNTSRLHCAIPREEAADVYVTFKNGRGDVFGMAWGDIETGLAMLSNLREGMGSEDFANKAGGCKMFWWLKPPGHDVNYMVALCDNGQSKVVVAFP